MKKLLNEVFDIKFGKLKTKTGNSTPIVYIDPATSENTYPYKDRIKNDFSAKWSSVMKTWFWFAGDDRASQEQLIKTKVKPCLEYLMSVEQTGDGGKRDIIAEIDKLLSALDGAEGDQNVKTIMSASDIKAKVESFKDDLINALDDEDFKRKMEPIIKFRQAQGHQFSFLNALLIMVQDRNAKLVKAKSRWMALNREVIPGSPAIFMWVPLGDNKKTAEQKENITNQFLSDRRVKSKEELTPGDKEELSIRLKSVGNATSFKLIASFYDIRYTRPIKGKEDLVGDGKTDLPWFEDGEETADSARYFDAMLKVIEESGVRLSYTDDLGGARGVSKSGNIELLQNGKKDIGALNTIVHEFSHEMLHQKYLKNNNPDLQTYFVGTAQGRAKVEQQAEICAWLVLKTFGYDLKTSINYVGIWGADPKNCVETFNTVSRVATYIVDGINKNLNNGMNESSSGFTIPNGEELADMLGYGDVYRQGLHSMNKVNSVFEGIINNVKTRLFDI